MGLKMFTVVKSWLNKFRDPLENSLESFFDLTADGVLFYLSLLLHAWHIIDLAIIYSPAENVICLTFAPGSKLGES